MELNRVQERLAVARRAVRTLQAVLQVQPVTDIVRDAAIQRFEYSFETVWKAAQRYLRDIEAIEAASPWQVIRAAFQAGVLGEPEAWQALIRFPGYHGAAGFHDPLSRFATAPPVRGSCVYGLRLAVEPGACACCSVEAFSLVLPPPCQGGGQGEGGSCWFLAPLIPGWKHTAVRPRFLTCTMISQKLYYHTAGS